MKISMIAAIGKQGQIGLNGTLPWDLPDDRAIFRDTIKDKHTIVGYNTYQTLAKILPLCTNYVISTRSHRYSVMLDTALSHAHEAKVSELVVVGGGVLYDYMLDMADKLYITHVDYDGPADIWFPEIDPNQWEKQVVGFGEKCVYCIYHRIAY